MTDYRTELQAFVDAAASFTEPALGHHKAWAEAVARARAVLSVPESSAKTACSSTPPPELFAEWLANSLRTLGRKVSEDDRGTTGLIAGEVAIQAARWGADQELESCVKWLVHNYNYPEAGNPLRAARRPTPPSLKERIATAIAHGDTSIALALLDQALPS